MTIDHTKGQTMARRVDRCKVVSGTTGVKEQKTQESHQEAEDTGATTVDDTVVCV